MTPILSRKKWIHLSTAPGHLEFDEKGLEAYFAPLVSHFPRYETRWAVKRGRLYRVVKESDRMYARLYPGYSARFVMRLGMDAGHEEGSDDTASGE